MSKVGLSICALTVVSVLGAAFSEHGLDDRRHELWTMAQRLCDLISAAALGYGDSVRSYAVPRTTAGEAVLATVTTDGVVMSAGAASVVGHPCAQVHLWQWDGDELNNSVIARLDAESRSLTLSSGQGLEIIGMSLMVSGDLRVMVFVLRPSHDGAAQNLPAISSTANASASISARVL